jgi:hypothetical protein
VQEQNDRRRLRSLVDVVHPKRHAASINVDVVGAERIAVQIDKPFVGST